MLKKSKEIPQIYWLTNLIVSCLLLIYAYATYFLGLMYLEPKIYDVISSFLLAGLGWIALVYLLFNIFCFIYFLTKKYKIGIVIPAVYFLYFIYQYLIIGKPITQTDAVIKLIINSIVFLFFVGFSIYQLRKSKSGWLR